MNSTPPSNYPLLNRPTNGTKSDSNTEKPPIGKMGATTIEPNSPQLEAIRLFSPWAAPSIPEKNPPRRNLIQSNATPIIGKQKRSTKFNKECLASNHTKAPLVDNKVYKKYLPTAKKNAQRAPDATTQPTTKTLTGKEKVELGGRLTPEEIENVRATQKEKIQKKGDKIEAEREKVKTASLMGTISDASNEYKWFEDLPTKYWTFEELTSPKTQNALLVRDPIEEAEKQAEEKRLADKARVTEELHNKAQANAEIRKSTAIAEHALKKMEDLSKDLQPTTNTKRTTLGVIIENSQPEQKPPEQ
ncbi:hypothetical protein FNU76_05890 [Chitinimonas arctica]|uniref:Uncharacterized protein n=1 Tax=Chitinimonas arctica TaxID=2594795 RepID=A0A516SCQ1_9NEIS|nr:hypothetical protein [Chitinimonas arctica]QDQ25921.1 hypothetical protein FNU76_05890 [Chitinimonas arctica]